MGSGGVEAGVDVTLVVGEREWCLAPACDGEGRRR